MSEKDSMVILGISDQCNFNCLFCLDKNWKGKGFVPLDHIKKLFFDIADGGQNRVMLMRGESLIRKDIFDVLDAARQNALKVCITTNGSMLSYYPFLKKLIQHGVVRIHVSVHSHIPKIANAIARHKACHGLQKKALENIDLFFARQKKSGLRMPLRIQINTVVCRLNYQHLDTLVQYLKRTLRHTPFEIKFKAMILDPCDGDLARRLVVPFKQIRPFLLRAVRLMGRSRVRCCSFPLCVLSPYERINTELQESQRMGCYYLDGVKAKDTRMFDAVARQEFTRYRACGRCSLASLCVGVHRSYAHFFPRFDLKTSCRDPKKILAAVRTGSDAQMVD